MIYLILDSDVWLNAIHESGKEKNFVANLEYWIEHNYVQIILPGVILKEWARNRDKKKERLVEDWHIFRKKAKKIFGTEITNETLTPEKLDLLSEEQLERIESIFNNHAIIIPITDEHRLKAVKLAEEKKAPFGSKNSIGDAYVFLAMVDYISRQGLKKCVFITNNYTDFSKKNISKEVHPDLEPEFTKLKIDYYTDVKYFLHKYKSELPTSKAIEEYKKLEELKKEDKKLTESFTNPLLLENLTGLRDSYIDNINHLDLILKEKNPTKQQVVFALGIINSDDSYKEYFFSKVKFGIWLEIFIRKSIYNPEYNPSPIKVKDGYQIPSWQPLPYLERLSNQIKQGEGLEFIDSILSIIKDASENPKDNYRTWYLLIKILSNIPNEKVLIEFLNFIPVWLDTIFDTSLQSSTLCENLLPKFLSEKPTDTDIEKAEIILKHLFALKIKENSSYDETKEQDKSYYSKVNLHFLKTALIDKDLISRVACFCSNNIIIFLSENLKKLYFDFPEGLNASLKSNDKEFNINVNVNGKNLVVSNNPHSVTITGFEQYDEKQTKSKLIEALKELNVIYPLTKENKSKIDVLVHYLFNGRGFMFSSTSVSKLDDIYHHAETEIEVFSLLFRDLLNKIMKYDVDRGIKLLEEFTFNNSYRHPFYQRIVLFVTSENWEIAESIFWKQINNSKNALFCNSDLYRELYELLKKNQNAIDSKGIEILNKIIENGYPESRNNKKIDFWRLRWYSALNETEPFKTKYNTLSLTLKKTSDYYEKDNKITIKKGDTSPLSIEDILQKSNKEIAEYIHSFKPKYSWDGPTIGGLSRIIDEAVKYKPSKFSEEIELYNDIYYIYIYHILNGFRDAWKNGKTFDWRKILLFCKKYILSPKFVSGELALENDTWGATQNWVISSIAELLTEGMRSDEHAFDLELLPLVKKIVKLLVSYLQPVEKAIQADTDFPTYTLNSSAGKVLMALLDYSLRRARNLEQINESSKWENDIIEIFEQTFDKGIIDGYILTGWHFEQFYFLNKKWILNKVKYNHALEEKEWKAFFGSFTFGNPPFNKEIYQLFYPYYQTAIQGKIKFKGFYSNGIIRHIVAFYFWGFEDLEKEGLLIKFINQSPPSSILELVNFIWRQEKYQENLTLKEKEKFEKIILELWTFLCHKYQNTQNKEERKILARLSSFLVYVPELNQTYTSLILKSNFSIREHFYFGKLLENLIRLKTTDNSYATAEYIGEILDSISFGSYISTIDQTNITNLVIYIYDNEHKQLGDKICNKMARKGYDFLIELHNKYK